ncbi:MAG: APC family permease [Syntrophomonadaceae bacterium]|nr:APC family permease [Syntrophomonadaceae bacterium]
MTSQEQIGSTDMKKSLSLWHYFTMGFGAIIGTGWLILVGDWLEIGGGPIAALLAFAVGALILFPVGAVFGELSAAIPVSGGTVEFIDKAFGFRISYIASWFLLLGNAILCPWESIAIASLMGELFPFLKTIPLYSIMGATIYLPTLLIALAIAGYIVYMNYRGIEQAAGVQSALTKIILLGAVVIFVVAIIKGSPSNMMPVFQDTGSSSTFLIGFLQVLVMTPFFYSGFETIPQQAEEAEEGINYKKFGAIIGMALLTSGLFYIVVIISYGSLMPWLDFIKIPFPGFNALDMLGLGFVGKFMLFAALCGIITTLNSFFISATRIMIAMSRKDQLPSVFAKLHPTYRTPLYPTILIGALTLIGPFLGEKLLVPLTNVVSLALIAACFLVSCAAMKLRFSEPDLKRPYKTPGGLVGIGLAILASAAVLLLIIVPTSPAALDWPLEWLIVLVWMVLGCFLMLTQGKKQRSISLDFHEYKL